MKPKHQRLIFVAVSMAFLVAAALLTLRAFHDNLIFFYSPSELAQAHIQPGQVIRIGGLVTKGSLMRGSDERITFDVDDGKDHIQVSYQGLLPALFREGQGVVAEGSLGADGVFTAREVLAKHDENYMPPEVAKAIKEAGQWRDGKK